MAAVEFIEDSARAVTEMFRVAKTGGQVLIGTINADSDWGEYYQTKKEQGISIYRYASLSLRWRLRCLLSRGKRSFPKQCGWIYMCAMEKVTVYGSFILYLASVFTFCPQYCWIMDKM